MKKRLFLCILLISGTACTKRVASVTETDTGTITGWVVNGDNEGIGGADVILRNRGMHPDSTTTSFDGFYSFDSIAAGKYYIEINAHDTLGAVVEAEITEDAPEAAVDSVVVKPFGTIQGSLDNSLVRDDATFLYLVELDREVPVGNLGWFLISGVPARDYTIRLIEDDSIVTSLLDTVVISVAGKDTAKIFHIGTKSGTVTIDGTIEE